MVGGAGSLWAARVHRPVGLRAPLTGPGDPAGRRAPFDRPGRRVESRVMNPTLNVTAKWVGGIIATFVIAIVIYLAFVFQVYLLAWIVEFIAWIFG